MKVDQDHLVSLDYTLTDDQGRLIDSSDETGPLSYVHGHGQILPALEHELEGQEVGYSAEVTVTAEDGFGRRDDDRVTRVPREFFEFEPQRGQVVRAEMPNGVVAVLQVLDVDDEHVTVDGNHPLSGKTLHFDVTVVGVRPATAEELQIATLDG